MASEALQLYIKLSLTSVMALAAINLLSLYFSRNNPLPIENGEQFKHYYDDVATGNESFTVLDVYVRTENNFL